MYSENFKVDFSNIKEGQTIAVAISGGKDSMCLLDVLTKNAKKLNITVKGINIDHSIRGLSSVKDSDFVQKYCNNRHIDLYFERVDVPSFCKENKLGLEEGARKLRYQTFFRAIDSGFCDIIATAHHLSDNAETLLFNLFRGCSPSGATGINAKSYGGKIIRPLINVTREQIDEYISTNDIPFVFDESNLDDEYSRNFIRNEIMPLIKSRFPDCERALGRFTSLVKDDEEFLNGEAQKALTRNGNEICIKSSLPKPIFSRACILAMKELGIKKDFEKKHIDQLINLLELKNGSEIDLLCGVNAVNDYGKITIFCSSPLSPFEEQKFTLSTFEYNGVTCFF